MSTIAMDSATAATSRTRGGRPRFWLIGTVAGAFLGLVLLVAVWAKALDPLAFAEQIRTEKLDFLLSAQAVALIALALEAGLGLALLLGLRRTWILVPATLLVAFFLFLTGRTYWLDSQGLLDEKAAASCGCFGNLVQRSPAEAFWQDLLMLVPPLALAFAGRDRRSRRFPPVRTVAVAATALGATLFAWKAPDLPLDDLATRLKPDVKVAELCVGGDDQTAPVCLDTVAPDLAEGEHLVVMANLDDPALTDAVDAMNEYARQPGKPRLSVLSPSPPEQHHAFLWQWGPVFQIVEAPAPVLRPLYRRLPRSFMVQDGKVTRTFPGLPPDLQTPTGERTAPSPV
ncbi:MAG TPA: MauE/DoxX family redox-associated membrane protein [Thermoanaerobaculia bacterium]|nr:MauE/DoxX family redox-associated membrane protein [Thermoanaerobaculia bacterium]